MIVVDHPGSFKDVNEIIPPRLQVVQPGFWRHELILINPPFRRSHEFIALVERTGLHQPVRRRLSGYFTWFPLFRHWVPRRPIRRSGFATDRKRLSVRLRRALCRPYLRQWMIVKLVTHGSFPFRGFTPLTSGEKLVRRH